ncbi:MAG TPA: DUF6152 family protein [Rhizobiaceae bacterium]|nr:DUF6152 family protein [Rhizobiaceae bacterium]
MHILKSSRAVRASVAGIALWTAAAGAAFAHHGWSWTEDGFFELEGIIKEISIGNPHAALDVDVEGEIWRVELAPPSATISAGFTEDAAKAGDEVTAIGNRSRDETEKRMKAVRLIVNGKTYDIYPNRVPPA